MDKLWITIGQFNLDSRKSRPKEESKSLVIKKKAQDHKKEVYLMSFPQFPHHLSTTYPPPLNIQKVSWVGQYENLHAKLSTKNLLPIIISLKKEVLIKRRVMYSAFPFQFFMIQ